MNFLKEAQELAASANKNTSGDNTTEGAAPAGAGSAAPPGAEGKLPGGNTAPTNEELLHSGQVLFGAAQGQKVDQNQLAGAASDVLGGLSARGNLDEGTYGKYANQAEEYLDKYAAKGQAPGASPAGAGAPPALGDSQSAPEVPARTTDQ